MNETQKTAVKAVYFSIVGNSLLALAKGIAGFFGNSYALIADAIESTTDIFSSLLVLVGIRYSTRPPDENHPYGHGRIEPIITFIIVGFLMISATLIAYESIENINTPHALPKPWTLIVLGAIIVWKEISYRVVLRKSKLTNSTSLKADAWHHRSDAITSVSAFIGIAIALIMGEGYEAADDWAALLASGFILYNCYQILRPAWGEMMDEHLHEDVEKEIRSIARQVEGIIDTEKCYIRKSGMTYHVDLHAIVDGDITVRSGHHLAHVLQDTLHEKIPNLGYISIHIEPTPRTKTD